MPRTSHAPGGSAPAPALAASPDETFAARRAREYLQAHLRESVALAELAGVAGVTKFALLRAFARELGVPPHAYHTRLRLAHARRLIDDGAPLSHVAFDAGFADQSHLTRRFKAHFGVTPGAYARGRGGAPAS